MKEIHNAPETVEVGVEEGDLNELNGMNIMNSDSAAVWDSSGPITRKAWLKKAGFDQEYSSAVNRSWGDLARMTKEALDIVIKGSAVNHDLSNSAQLGLARGEEKYGRRS